MHILIPTNRFSSPKRAYELLYNLELKALDYIVAIIFISLIVLSFFLYEGGDDVIVNANGIEYSYPLSEDRTFSVIGPLGETTIEIKDGSVRIIDSPCPNKTCLNTSLGRSICCLPNRVLITISEKDGDIDAYAY